MNGEAEQAEGENVAKRVAGGKFRHKRADDQPDRAVGGGCTAPDIEGDQRIFRVRYGNDEIGVGVIGRDGESVIGVCKDSWRDERRRQHENQAHQDGCKCNKRQDERVFAVYESSLQQECAQSVDDEGQGQQDDQFKRAGTLARDGGVLCHVQVGGQPGTPEGQQMVCFHLREMDCAMQSLERRDADKQAADIRERGHYRNACGRASALYEYWCLLEFCNWQPLLLFSPALSHKNLSSIFSTLILAHSQPERGEFAAFISFSGGSVLRPSSDSSRREC